MELKWLEDFMALAAAANFTRAARERNITQSAFSRRIQSLEDWIGAPLVRRDSHPVVLTAEGQSFLHTACDVVEAARTAQRSLRDQAQAKNGVLTFTSLHTLSMTFFPHWITELKADVGEFVTKMVLYGNAAGSIAAFSGGDADFFLTFHNDSNPLPLPQPLFEFRDLGSERLVPVCLPTSSGRPRYQLSERSEPIPYVMRNSDSYLGAILEQACRKWELNLSSVFKVSSGHAVKAMLLAGHGVAWLPESHVRTEIAEKRVVRADDERWDIVIGIRIYRHTRRQREIVENFWSAVERSARTSVS